MIELHIESGQRAEFLAVTREIQQAVSKHKWTDGVLTVFVPHTTAGVTIQENADPDVIHDMMYALEKCVPWNDSRYRHSEGNTAAHVKASLMGSSVQCIVENGKLQLGTWQGIFLCEFDGPRRRNIWLSFQPSG